MVIKENEKFFKKSEFVVIARQAYVTLLKQEADEILENFMTKIQPTLNYTESDRKNLAMLRKIVDKCVKNNDFEGLLSLIRQFEGPQKVVER